MHLTLVSDLETKFYEQVRVKLLGLENGRGDLVVGTGVVHGVAGETDLHKRC